VSEAGPGHAGGAPRPAPHADADRFDRYEARRCRRRRRSIVLLCFAGVLVGAWLVVAHSPLTRRMIVPRVEAMLNATVEGGEVSVGLDGVVTIRNALLRVPSVRGTAGAVFEVARLNVRPTWRRVLGWGGAGEPWVREVVMVEPLVRLSQSVADGSMNFAAMDLPSPSGGAGALPTITVRRGVIELGEHWTDAQGAPRYAVLKRLDVNGEVSPSKDLKEGVYRIAVQQIGRDDVPPRPDVPAPRLLGIEGTLSASGVSITMTGISLDDWPPSSVPTRLREVSETLDLEGEVRRTRLNFDAREGLRAELELGNVAVNLPIDATEEPIEGPAMPAPLARMRSVNGTVTYLRGGVEAELNGLLEDLPYRVRLKYLGLTEDAPFECDLVCENFRMEEKPQVLRFAPPMVRYRLAQFSNPTGLVTARAYVRRGPPERGRAADVRVNGTLEFNDVTAAYAGFPYRFSGITGFIRFDDRTLEIRSLEGVAPGGGRVFATAHVSPLTDSAGAHIEVKVLGIPIDDRLEEAMGARRKLVQEIASSDQHRRLAERGAFLTPERERILRDRLAEARLREAAQHGEARDAARREIEAIEESLRTPVFAFRGAGDVSVVIDRLEGAESIWTELIEVRLGRVGLLPDRFPLPIDSEGVRVVIDGHTVKVEGGTYRGLNGGEATVSASMLYPTLDDPDIDPLPRARIEATGVPIDALITHAVAGAVDRATRQDGLEAESEPGAFVGGLLSGLRLGGTLDATTDLTSDESGTHVAAEARSNTMVARPRRGAAEAEIRAKSARVSVTDSHVGVEVEGSVIGDGGAPDAGVLTLAAGVDISRTEPSAWNATINGAGLDVSRPIEAAVGVFSEEAAERIARLRAATNPAGRVTVGATLSGGAPGLAGEVTLTDFHGATLDALGSRITLSDSSGAVRIHPFDPGHEDAVVFDAFRAGAACDGRAVGVVTLDGEATGLGTPAMGGSLQLGVEGARFEHPFVRRLALEHSGPGLRDAVERSSPEGEFDASASFASGGAGLELKRGTLRPRSLTLALPSGRAEWPEMSGTIEFRPDSGSFHGLRGRGREEEAGRGPAWSFDADGSWVIPAPGAVAVQADVSLESHGLSAGLRSVLPEELTSAIGELDFKAGGEIRVPRATVTYNDNGTSQGRSVRVTGGVDFDGVSLEAGAPVTDCAGVMDFDVRRESGGPATFDLWGLMSSLRFAGMAMTDGRLRLSGGGEAGDVLVPEVSADCYGGRATGKMSLRRQPNGPRRYDAALKLAGVRFAPVLRDLGAAEVPEGPPSSADHGALDESRGRLDANLSLAGVIGDDQSRRGRGSGMVGGGSVIELPLLLPLIRFSNLQLPLDERLRLATGEFYITGNTVVLEDVSAFSDSVRIFGFGTATWPELDLNLRFNSRAVRRLPVISGLLESIRDEIVSTSVTGNIRDPKVSTTPLGTTSRMLDSLFGTPSQQDQLMQQIERRAVEDLDRARTGGRRAGWGESVAPRGGR